MYLFPLTSFAGFTVGVISLKTNLKNQIHVNVNVIYTTIIKNAQGGYKYKMRIICQRTTSAVIHIFTQQGYTSDFYFDDVYDAEDPVLAFTAFQDLQFLFDQLGLQSSSEKNCSPATKMVCLDIEVDNFILRVPFDHLQEHDPTRDPFIQRCLRQLWFTASLCDLEIRAFFIPGEHNVLASNLSRWNLYIKYQEAFDSYCTWFSLKYTVVDVPDHAFAFQIAQSFSRLFIFCLFSHRSFF